MTASLLYKIPCLLGEGGFWHPTRQSFFWVDIDGRSLHEYNILDKKVSSWNFPDRPSMIALDKQDQLVLVFQSGVAKVDLQTEKLSWLLDVEKDIPDNRTNDGGVDICGRLWIGTMNVKFKEGAGSLYCVAADLSITKKIQSLAIPNGLVWSLDNQVMYHIDSPTRKVRAYRFDSKTGSIEFEKVAITVPEEIGSPDGMCIDEEGMLWIAHWNGFGVYRWDPIRGILLDKIDVPVPQVSSCTFGGSNMDQLFITTAREGFSAAQSEKYPDSGSVFIAQPGVKGVKKNIFAY